MKTPKDFALEVRGRVQGWDDLWSDADIDYVADLFAAAMSAAEAKGRRAGVEEAAGWLFEQGDAYNRAGANGAMQLIYDTSRLMRSALLDDAGPCKTRGGGGSISCACDGRGGCPTGAERDCPDCAGRAT